MKLDCSEGKEYHATRDSRRKKGIKRMKLDCSAGKEYQARRDRGRRFNVEIKRGPEVQGS